MKRRRMLLAVIAGTPLLLVLLAITLPPLLVGSESFRARVIALVKAHTGRDLHIDGEMRLRLFPRALLQVTDVRLANTPGLTERAFAELAELEMELNLMPLLAGRIEMERLVARGLTLNLERGEGGRGNWEGLVRGDDDARSASATDDGAPAAIGAMALRDATITWRDPATGTVTPIADIDVEFAALHAGTRIDDLHVRVTLAGGTSPEEAAVIDARGDVELVDAGTGFLMPKIDATITNAALAGARIDATLDTRLAADFTRQRLSFDNLHVSARARAGEDTHATLVLGAELQFDLAGQRLAPVEVTLEIPAYTVSGLGGELRLSGVLSGDLQAGNYALKEMQSHGSVGKENGGGERVPFSFGADLELSTGGRVLTAKNLQLSVGEKRAKGMFEVRAADAPPGTAGVFDLVVEDQALSGNFRLSESGAGHELHLDVLADLAHPAGSASAGGRLAVALQADVDVNLENETLRSENLRLALDESRIEGFVETRGFDAPAVRFDLQADTIDADRLLPLPVGEQGQNQTTPVAATIDAIRALDLSGEMRVDRMTLRGLELENVRIRFGEGANDG